MSKSLKLKITHSSEHNHFHLEINDVYLGEYERSVFRHMLSVIDDKIGTGAVHQDTDMTAEDFSAMVAAAREAAMNDDSDDCVMCGS